MNKPIRVITFQHTTLNAVHLAKAMADRTIAALAAEKYLRSHDIERIADNRMISSPLLVALRSGKEIQKCLLIYWGKCL